MGEVSDEEFYENIEAPKFVDFKATDAYHSDDGYWFCSRVGCDRKHEEELDHETISRNFFLRIMAARSPNVKFQKAINNRSSRIDEQCPLSVPAKSSKSRVSRMVQISLFSQKMVDAAEKVEPPPSTSLTSKSKRKQVASRYLATKVDKQLPLGSGQDSKPAFTEAIENEAVSKTSPKNFISEKTALDMCTPLTKIGTKMKKLEITSQWKRILGYSKKTSADPRSDLNKTKPVGPSKKQVSDFKDKGKPRESLKLQNSDNQNRHTTSKSYSIPNQKVKKEPRLRDIDAKSKGPRNAHEERLKKKVPCSKVSALGRKMNSSSSNDLHLEENDILKSRGVQYRSSRDARNRSEFMDSDDKENVSASDGESRRDRNIWGSTMLRNQEKVLTQKAASKPEAKLKEQGLEYKKPKPTNPRPFRLRTDERGILKEANLDRGTHTLPNPTKNLEKNKVVRKGNDVDKRAQKIAPIPMAGADPRTASERQVQQRIATKNLHRPPDSVHQKPRSAMSGKM